MKNTNRCTCGGHLFYEHELVALSSRKLLNKNNYEWFRCNVCGRKYRKGNTDKDMWNALKTNIE